MRKVIGVFAAGVMTTLVASASIITVLDSGPSAIGPNFAYNYRADLSGDERLDPVATNGMTCPGPSNTLIQCNPTGTFFTIYDISGFVSASTTASGWSMVSQLVGVTPSSISGTAIDNPALTNVTFEYSGPLVAASGSILSTVGFQVVSSFSGVNPNGKFTSQSTQNSGPSAGATDQTVGSVAVPESTVPEPSLLAIMGSALIGLAASRRLAVR